MEYRINEEGNIEVIIEAKNNREFRFKKRQNRFIFGETFPARKKPFDKQVYLEWQISYDVKAIDVEKKNIKVELNKHFFIGSNGKKKYPAELSELFYTACKQNFISKEEVKNLLNEIIAYQEFIDEKSISVIDHKSKITLNNVSFEETSINLPTLFMVETDGTYVEVSIEKQQYASGVQPMVYFCIPLITFKNSSDLLNKPSSKKDKLIYVINKYNSQNLVNLVRIFGMASKRHNHDIIEIMKMILSII